MKELKNNTLATFPQIKITKTPGKAQTGKNVMQDGKPMYKRKDGKVVKRGIWSNSYLSNRKQEGGAVEQQQPDLMSLFSWFAENVPDDDFNSPEDVAKEFQQLSPKQQQQFVASIQQQMGSMQYGGMSVNASPTKKYQEGGMDEMSMLGYSDDSPYRDYEMLPIDSNYLTMDNVGIPLIAKGNQSGEVQYMSPYSGDYYFPNDENVTEYPLAQMGGVEDEPNIYKDYSDIYYNNKLKYINSDDFKNYLNSKFKNRKVDLKKKGDGEGGLYSDNILKSLNELYGDKEIEFIKKRNPEGIEKDHLDQHKKNITLDLMDLPEEGFEIYEFPNKEGKVKKNMVYDYNKIPSLDKFNKKFDNYYKEILLNKPYYNDIQDKFKQVGGVNIDSYESLKSIAEGYGLENINSPEDLQRIVNSAQSTGWNLPSLFLDKVGKLKTTPKQKVKEEEDEWITLPTPKIDENLANYIDSNAIDIFGETPVNGMNYTSIEDLNKLGKQLYGNSFNLDNIDLGNKTLSDLAYEFEKELDKKEFQERVNKRQTLSDEEYEKYDQERYNKSIERTKSKIKNHEDYLKRNNITKNSEEDRKIKSGYYLNSQKSKSIFGDDVKKEESKTVTPNFNFQFKQKESIPLFNENVENSELPPQLPIEGITREDIGGSKEFYNERRENNRLPNLNQLQSRLPYSISDANIANRWVDRMSDEMRNISNYQAPNSIQAYRNDYMNLAERNPNFSTPNQIPVKEKKFNISEMNSSDAWKMKQSDAQKEISSKDPKIFKRDKNGKIIESPDADWDKIIDLKRDSPFEYAPMLQNYANALNQDPQYRATANIKGAFTPELDVRGAIQAIDNELKDSMRNVDMNSTQGAAIAAQLQANASKNKLNVINDAAQKNAQIRGQNSQSEANRQNQQNQMQQQFDASYYDNILRSRSASQQEKNRALNALLSRKEQKDAFETNLAVATMPYNNFKYKPGEGVFRNNKVEFYAKEIEAKKAEEEEKKKTKAQIGGWGNKFKFKNI